MTNTKFVERVKAIAATNPTYRTGGDGSDGTCDCIGLIMGALGREFPMHSTNYFARFEMAELAPIRKDTDIELGSLVYKTRDEGSPGYDLHERYKQGGRYFSGIMLDFYHVGVVTSVDPLVITHCTQNDGVDGIDYDTSLNGWTYCGEAADVEYGDEEGASMSEKKYAVVTADSGFTVNMRKRPDKASPVMHPVPIGSIVEVQETAQGWATIVYNGQRGYMMAEFLDFMQEKEPDERVDEVTVTIPYEAAEALFYALKEVIM